jgi:hypothetical protein
LYYNSNRGYDNHPNLNPRDNAGSDSCILDCILDA